MTFVLSGLKWRYLNKGRHSSALIVILLLFVAVVGCVIWQKKAREPGTSSAPIKELGTGDPVAKAVSMKGPPTELAKGAQDKAPEKDLDPARYRRAYLLSLDGSKLGLENAEDIEGDFASTRRRQEEWTGMLRCRLISAEGKVVAEELLPAPDHLCTVLDARDGTPKPVSYTPPGPVLFQLRLPRRADAARLEVARITGPGVLARDVPIGSIPLLSP